MCLRFGEGRALADLEVSLSLGFGIRRKMSF
jgi:hypothetical protein